MTSQSDRRKTRDKILARRALYLSTALAAMGCSNSKSPQPPGSGSASAQATGNSTTQGSGTTQGNGPGKVAPEAPYDKVLAERPPFEVPDTLAATEKAQLNGLNAGLENKYAAIGKVWRQVPGCDPSAAACKPKWEALAEDAQAMYRMFDGGVGGCPGLSGRTGSYRLRQQAHARYQQSLIKRLEVHLRNVAMSYGYGSEGRVQRMIARAKEPPPMPCLSPCAMPPLNDITEVVTFTKGSASLRLDEGAVKRPLMQVLSAQTGHGKRTHLVIRGHADPSEPDADKLASARAQAVFDWLVSQGIAKQQLRATGLGTQLLVAKSGGDDDSNNARVDFLVVKAP